MKNNYEYKEINTQIGKIRMRQALALKNTGCFVLCGTFIGACFVDNPTTATAFILGADFLTASYYGVKSYLYQRQINILNEEKEKIKRKIYSS